MFAAPSLISPGSELRLQWSRFRGSKGIRVDAVSGRAGLITFFDDLGECSKS